MQSLFLCIVTIYCTTATSSRLFERNFDNGTSRSMLQIYHVQILDGMCYEKKTFVKKDIQME